MSREMLFWLVLGFLAGYVFSIAMMYVPRKHKAKKRVVDCGFDTSNRINQVNLQTWVPIEVEGNTLYKLEVKDHG